MKKSKDEVVSEGLNQIFEIINAKGDERELSEIVQNRDKKPSQKLNK